MKNKLKAIVKRSRLIYSVYFFVGSLFLRFLGLFIRTDSNLVLFVSYGGQKFDDSPRVLYEYISNQAEYSHLKKVWAFIEPEKFPEIKNSVRIDTLRYYTTALKAGYWITNSSASRGLNLKKATTVNVLFQHGMCGLKKLGDDLKQQNKGFRQNYHEKFDFVFVEGRKEIPILTNAWKMPQSSFYQTGLPRNDNLTTYSVEETRKIKDKFKIPYGKKVILYAPTFREYSCNQFGQITMELPFHVDKWREQLEDEYVLLVTAHYEVAKLFGKFDSDGFVFNAFKYPEINDLLAVADILISDYSSVVFDYSILERPIFCYGYDYNRYMKERGFYTDPKSIFSKGVIGDENELIQAIKFIDYDAECNYTREHIKREFICSYGNAAEKAAKIIFE